MKDILIGTILGDASIYKTKDAAYITFEQNILKQDYLLSLYILFESYAKNPPKIYKRVDKRYNKENSSIYFRTQNLLIFNEFADIFLTETDNGKLKKIIPKNIYDLLTPIGLAILICDDGMAVKKKGITAGVTLCTDSFTFEEVLILKSVLENKFGFKCSIHTKRGANTYYRIYVSKISMPLLIPLVSQHMHSSMLYKIGL